MSVNACFTVLSATPAEHISISATFPAVYSTLTPHALAVTDEEQGAAPTVALWNPLKMKEARDGIKHKVKSKLYVPMSTLAK